MKTSSFILAALILPAPALHAQSGQETPPSSATASSPEDAAQLKRDISTSIGYSMGFIFAQRGNTPATLDTDLYITSLNTALKNGISPAVREEAKEKIADAATADEKKSAQSVFDGFNMAFSLLNNGFKAADLDMDVYRRAFEAALRGDVKEEDVRAYDASTERMIQIIKDRDAATARDNLPAARSFLQKNSGKPGIVTLPDGLQYRIEKQGTGRTYDEEQDGENPVYMVKYTMSDIHGNILDAQTQEATALMGPVSLDGMDEALTRMPIGSEWTLFISPELGFGEEASRDGRISIPGNSVLVIRIELLDIHQLAIPKVIPMNPDESEEDDDAEDDGE